MLWHVQVWHGALLLAEYILCHQDQLSDCVALEVAAGTGCAGIVMATIARRVFLTDSYGSVLTNCQVKDASTPCLRALARESICPS